MLPPAPPEPSCLLFLSPQNSDFLRELVVTIAREGLEDKYGLQLNPGEEQEAWVPHLGEVNQCVKWFLH